MDELWENIPYHPRFQASTLGRIRSIPFIMDHPRKMKYTIKGRIRKFCKNRRGYLIIKLSSNFPTKTVHRLIAMTFIPNPNKFPEINHKNGIKTDNRVENLEWCTRIHNCKHAYNTGLSKAKFGIDQRTAKMDDLQVRTIKRCISDGIKDRSLAYYFNIGRRAITDIRLGVTWKHIAP